MIDDDYGAVGGMRIGRGNRRTRKKPAPVPSSALKMLPDVLPYSTELGTGHSFKLD
jgi:hypothetical protein